MTREEMLNEAQSGTGKSYPKLDIYFRLKTKSEVVKNAEGFEKKVPSFTWQEQVEENGEKKYVDKYMAKPIEGFMLGEAMMGEVFVQSIGKKGGSFKTTPYFSKTDFVLVFHPTEQKPMKFDNIELADAWLATNAGVKFKKRRVYYIATEKGILELNTNISLSIDQTNRLVKENASVFRDSLLSFMPALYSPSDTLISKATHDIQGAIGAANPSAFARLSVVRKMAEADWTTFKVDEALQSFITWKRSKVVERAAASNGTLSPANPAHGAYEVPAAQPIPSSHIPASAPFTPADDLPF